MTSWRDGKFCHWCGCRLLKDWPSRLSNHPRSITKEHIIPRALGGSNDQRNLTAACRQCNHTRATDTSWVPFKEGGFPPYLLQQEVSIGGRLNDG